MTAAEWLSTVAWFSASLALLPLFMLLTNLRRFDRPRAMPASDTAVSILIPARNEAHRIEHSVRHALASTGVNIEVIVLDDQSDDGTAAIVQQLAGHDDRVRLMHAPELGEDWAGKQRACFLLGHAARHDILMFVDADVTLEPRAAALAAARLLEDTGLGMVSGFPREDTGSLAECLTVPWIHVLLLGYLPMAWMRRTTHPAFAAACGQWIVARRSAWLATGGHAAAPMSRHDGLSLPRTFRTGGWRTDLFDGTGLARCRMYHDFRSVWNGFGKNPGEGLATPVALPLWTVLIGAGHILPWLMLAATPWFPTLLAPALTGVGANLVLRGIMCRRLAQSWRGALLHPVGAMLMLAVNGSALLRHLRGRPSTWAGRSYVPRQARG